jgi:Cof subfamily protein (haloacid dehalogenase superfamily)
MHSNGQHPAAPNPPIRMIALDVDGTLFRSNKTIGRRTIEALQAAHKQGVQVVLASGRMTPAMESAVDQLELDVFIVSYNGAAICAPRADGRRRLFYSPLAAEVARELYLLGRDRRYQVNFYHEDVILTVDEPHLRPWIEVYRSRTGATFRFVEKMDDYLHHAPTKLLFVTDPHTRNRLLQEMAPSFGSRAFMVCSDPEYLEFLSPDVCKGRGVARLAEHRGIPISSVMALGDGDNDVTMLQMAGLGVAVANASPQCKAAAKTVTMRTNEDDAVAEAVEKYVLSPQMR